MLFHCSKFNLKSFMYNLKITNSWLSNVFRHHCLQRKMFRFFTFYIPKIPTIMCLFVYAFITTINSEYSTHETVRDKNRESQDYRTEQWKFSSPFRPHDINSYSTRRKVRIPKQQSTLTQTKIMKRFNDKEITAIW